MLHSLVPPGRILDKLIICVEPFDFVIRVCLFFWSLSQPIGIAVILNAMSNCRRKTRFAIRVPKQATSPTVNCFDTAHKAEKRHHSSYEWLTTCSMRAENVSISACFLDERRSTA
tara:strand:+ start:466684 stop:467028 length:345 start_codon:yes stop_codon:yes gene_type:complete